MIVDALSEFHQDDAPVLPSSKYASRKFLIAVFLLLTSTGLLIAGLFSEGAVLTTWGTVATAYFVANVTQKKLMEPEDKL